MSTRTKPGLWVSGGRSLRGSAPHRDSRREVAKPRWSRKSAREFALATFRCASISLAVDETIGGSGLTRVHCRSSKMF